MEIGCDFALVQPEMERGRFPIVSERAIRKLSYDRFRRHLLRVLSDALQERERPFPTYAKTERESVCRFAREPRKLVKHVVAHG
jgi:hypothetical protein